MKLNLALIEESFLALKPHSDEVLEHFAEQVQRQTMINFGQRGWFPFPETVQKQIFGVLFHVIEYWQEESHVRDYLKKMGAKIGAHGQVQGNDFFELIQPILNTLEYYFAEQWNGELAQDWKTFLEITADHLAQGLLKKAKPVHSLTKSNGGIDEVLRIVTKEVIDSVEFKELIQAKVHEVLEKTGVSETSKFPQRAKTLAKSA